MDKVRIGDRWVGRGEPCFIIAEAGSNHNGDLDQAKRLIDVAAKARVDAVKFQVFRAERLYPRTAGVSDYLGISRPIYDIIAEMEMPVEWVPSLHEYCRERSVKFLASVFDSESVNKLDRWLPAYKIASYEMNHLSFVNHVAGKQKPVIVSTGTSDLEEVRETVDEFGKAGNDQLILMQCTAGYPAPTNALNLRAIDTLRRRFDVPVGLSDHSRDPLVAPMAAVALGAAVIEKHFTLDNGLPGPDHRFAVEPEELRTMVEKVRAVETALGSGEKEVQSVEQELRLFARRSIFAIRDIDCGERLTPKNISVLRCGQLGSGLPPKCYSGLLDRRAKRKIKAEALITIDDYD